MRYLQYLLPVIGLALTFVVGAIFLADDKRREN